MTNFLQPNVVNWNAIMAFAATYVTPILAAFVLLQRQIVNGLTSGALK
jgi:multiple sugar transport system permease protein